jgi:hypothetical protein
MPYFGVFAEQGGLYPPHSFHNFPLRSHFAYRLNSRLLIAEDVQVYGGSVLDFREIGCGAHYYLMGVDGVGVNSENRSRSTTCPFRFNSLQFAVKLPVASCYTAIMAVYLYQLTTRH